jgi:ferredoxin
MLVINDDCINCDACLSECPNHAIYEPDEEWSYADGTNLTGMVKLWDGREVDADEKHEALSDEFYYIVPDKCTECHGFHEEPQCAAVCPVDCIHVDEENPESEDLLAQKKDIMHA